MYDGSSPSPVPFTAELVLVLGCLPGLESKCIGDAIRNGKLVKTEKPFPEQGDRGFRQSQPSVFLPHTVNLFQRGKAGHLTLDK